jgi:biopolymer transport protein ExbD
MAFSQLSPLLAARRLKAKPAEDDIDITPMIDCVFLLLIFFLVTSTPDQQSSVELPSALHGKAVSQLESVVFTIAVGSADSAPVYAADGKLPDKALSEDPATRSEQVREAVELGVRENKTDVIVKADRGVAFRHVARVVADASAVPGVQLHLAVLDTE